MAEWDVKSVADAAPAPEQSEGDAAWQPKGVGGSDWQPKAVNGQTVGPRKGFWAEFGQATGGVKGLATAPFTSSIPVEAIKALAHPSRTYDEVETFLRDRSKRPLIDQMRDTVAELKTAAKEHPGLVVGELVHQFFADPELLFLPELGAARAAAGVKKLTEVAGAGARAARAAEAATVGATRVAGGAAIGGGSELFSELGEGRPIDPGAIALSGSLGGAVGGFAQVRLKGEKTKLSVEDIERQLGARTETAAHAPKAEVHPTADGYMVRVEGQSEGKTFLTKAEAEAAKQELDSVSSGYDVMETKVPRGAETRSRLIFENPFTPGNMRKWVKRPGAEEATRRLPYYAKAAAAAAIGAGLGYELDRDNPALGAGFGAVAAAGLRFIPKGKARVSVEEVVNQRNGANAVMARHLLQFKAAIEAAVPEADRRNAISLAMEGHSGISLNATEQAVAASVREFFNAMGQAGLESGVLKDLLHEYVTHIVEEDPKLKDGGFVDRLIDIVLQRERTPGGQPSGAQFAKHRRYATFEELHQALRGSGLKIKTGDIGEIMAIYGRSMFRSITDRRLITALRHEPVAGMRATVVPRQVEVPPEKMPGRTVEGTVTGEGPPAPRIGREQPPVLRQAQPADRQVSGQPEGYGFRLPEEPPPGAAAQRFAARPTPTLLVPIDKMDPNYTVLPSRQLAGLAVHRDIAPQLNFIFNARDPNDVVRGLMTLNQASKRAVVSFSLFHAKSLHDAFVGAMGLKAFTGGPYAVKHARKALDMFLRGGSNDGIDRGLRHGLVLQYPEDIATNQLGVLKKAAAAINETLPVSGVGKAANAIANFSEALDNFTFGTLQAGFKIITYLDAYERLIKKGLSEDASARAAASYANDLYGSLDWFRVANDVGSRFGRDIVYAFFNPTGRRFMQLMVFAPDWTISTFRAAYKALPGAVDDAALSALHRRYLLKSSFYYLTVGSALNLALSGHALWDNENPTRIQLADGRTMQWSKHFMEPFEWLRDPQQVADSKLAFLPREAIELGTGKEYVSAHDAAPDIDNLASHLVHQFEPITAQQGLAGGGASSVTGLFGMPIYGKDEEQRSLARLQKKQRAQLKKKKAAEYYQRQNR